MLRTREAIPSDPMAVCETGYRVHACESVDVNERLFTSETAVVVALLF